MKTWKKPLSRFIALAFIALSMSAMSLPAESAPSPKGDCMVGGCSRELCLEAGATEGMASTCEFRAEYACYHKAECKRQDDGKCGWTQTDGLKACLAHPPSINSPGATAQ